MSEPRRARFAYPSYGRPDGCPEYTAHSGQVVTVIRRLTDAECDSECQPMFLVLADDGWEGNVFGDELTYTQSEDTHE